MLKIILISLILCLLTSNILGQNRQKVECKTTTIHHIIIDTIPAQEETDLSKMGIERNALCIKQSTVAYTNSQPSTTQPPKCKLLFFDKKGNMVKQSDPMETDTTSTEIQNNVYAYNKLQEVLSYDATGREVAHLKYRYNTKGDIMECDSIYTDRTKPVYEFKYDRYHNIIYQINFSSDPNAYEFTFHYTYDPQISGRILVKSVDRRHLRSGEIYNFTTTYTYNSLGQVMQERMTETNGGVSLIVYTYNSSNQLISKNMKFPDLTLREEYIRDTFNSIIGTYYYVDNQLRSKTTNDIMYRNMDDNIAINPLAATEIATKGMMSVEDTTIPKNGSSSNVNSTNPNNSTQKKPIIILRK